MRIALVGPFTGPSLASRFSFAEGAGALPSGYPGAPLMTVLAAALGARGHEIGAITTDYAADAADRTPFHKFHGQGITAYFSPQRRRSFQSSGGQRGRSLDFFGVERERLLAAIRDFQPDVIHAHWTYEFAWASLDSGIPCLVTAHDSPWQVVRHMPNPYRALRYLMARHVIRRSEHLTAVSPDLKADIEAYGAHDVEVVSNPVDEDILRSEGCTPEAFERQTLIMILNGWTALKNGSTALRAFARARLKRPGLRLVCCGYDWEPGGAAQQWAARNGLLDGVDFRGAMPHGQILQEIRQSTGLLHPSRLEACSMVIAESMALGLPVIAGRKTPGVQWQLDNGRGGVLVDVNDVVSMADGIETLVSDRERWGAYSAVSRQRAGQLFSIDRIVDAYLDGYRRAMAPAAARSLACSG